MGRHRRQFVGVDLPRTILAEFSHEMTTLLLVVRQSLHRGGKEIGNIMAFGFIGLLDFCGKRKLDVAFAEFEERQLHRCILLSRE